MPSFSIIEMVRTHLIDAQMIYKPLGVVCVFYCQFHPPGGGIFLIFLIPPNVQLGAPPGGAFLNDDMRRLRSSLLHSSSLWPCAMYH